MSSGSFRPQWNFHETHDALHQKFYGSNNVNYILQELQKQTGVQFKVNDIIPFMQKAHMMMPHVDWFTPNSEQYLQNVRNRVDILNEEVIQSVVQNFWITHSQHQKFVLDEANYMRGVQPWYLEARTDDDKVKKYGSLENPYYDSI